MGARKKGDAAKLTPDISTEISRLERQLRKLRKQQPAIEEIDRKRRIDEWKIENRNAREICPHCGKEKFVVFDFGVRVSGRQIGKQPWCRSCRASTNYHVRPRKYHKATVSKRDRSS